MPYGPDCTRAEERATCRSTVLVCLANDGHDGWPERLGVFLTHAKQFLLSDGDAAATGTPAPVPVLEQQDKINLHVASFRSLGGWSGFKSDDVESTHTCNISSVAPLFSCHF